MREITPQEARAELERRARAELARRALADPVQYNKAVRALLVLMLHAMQQSVLQDVARGVRYMSLCCSRRAGKTHLLATLIVLFLLDLQFGQDVVFVAPTLKRGKELIWQEVARIIEVFQLPWKPTESRGTIRTLSGGHFRIVGLDKKNQIGKIARGGNTRAIFTDETQEFAHLLRDFIVAASPALGQTRGVFICAGTPGVAETGYWHAICHGAEGFSSRHWTLLDNPHLGRPAEDILREERELKGWTEDHPDYVREWLGKWTRDHRKLVVEFDALKNVIAAVPGYTDETRHKFRHIIAVDYGFKDPCAWVVLAAHPNEKTAYVVHVEKHVGLSSDEIAAKTQELKQKYKPIAIVADSASGGSTFIADWNRRYGSQAGVRMRPARKHDKLGSITTLNTELRTTRLRLVKGAADLLADEFKVLQWANEEHTALIEGPAFPDHAFDAVRYAVNEFTNYAHKPKRAQKTAAERETEMFDAMNRQAREWQEASGF